MKRKGNILIEGVFCLSLLLLSSVLSIELVRRAYWDFFLHYFTFFSARGYAVGLAEDSLIKTQKDYLKRVFNKNQVDFILSKSKPEGYLDTFYYRTYYRFPSLLSFSYRDQSKHHFEVTQKCPFPLSLD